VLHIPETAENEPRIHDKILRAREVWAAHGDAIMADPRIISSLHELSNAIEQSWKLMRRLRVVEGCGRCDATKAGGGCCGAGIEEWYDEYVLLMNLMLGRDIPEDRLDETCCLFLGPTGCRLMARFHFCINYLCHDIKERLSSHEMEELTAQNGREIYCGWLLENLIREKLLSLS
jgi:hypothetical protein